MPLPSWLQKGEAALGSAVKSVADDLATKAAGPSSLVSGGAAQGASLTGKTSAPAVDPPQTGGIFSGLEASLSDALQKSTLGVVANAKTAVDEEISKVEYSAAIVLLAAGGGALLLVNNPWLGAAGGAAAALFYAAQNM